VATLKICNSGLDRLVATVFDTSPPLLGFRPLLWETLG